MLFYVKCFGTIPNRYPPKTRLMNFSNNRTHLIPSFARSYRSSNKASKQNNINGKRKGSYLNNELSSSQSHCHQVGNNQQGFPRAELQLLPTSSESNFASASSDMRQSTLDKTDSVGRLEETKRLSQRYVKDRITSKTVFRSNILSYLINFQTNISFRSAADGASSPNCDVDTLVWLHNKIDLANPRSVPTKGVVNINLRKDRKSSQRRNSKFSVIL